MRGDNEQLTKSAVILQLGYEQTEKGNKLFKKVNCLRIILEKLVKPRQYIILSVIQLRQQRSTMKRDHQRKRQFSATRLSYSRNLTDKKPNTNFSPSQAQKHHKDHSFTFMCNNCYNKQLSKDKASKHITHVENNQEDQWGPFKNSEKNAQNYQKQVKKINEYNMQKIQQHQRQKSQLKNEKNGISAADFFGGKHQDAFQTNYNKRLELKRELQSQITAGKQRRQRQKQQLQDYTANFLVDQENTKKSRKKFLEEYKLSLLQQINQNKNKRLRQQQLQKKDVTFFQLPFFKEYQEKWELNAKVRNTLKEDLTEQLRKKKQNQQNLRANQNKTRDFKAKTRLQSERQLRQEKQKADEKRKNMINGYLEELRKQIQENQAKRQKYFKKRNQSNMTSFMTGENKSNPGSNNEPCACCFKQFPKNYLSPYVPAEQKLL